MLTSLEEKGIKTRVLNTVIPLTGSDDQICKGGYLEKDGICWKANLGDLVDAPQKQKYIYLSASPEQIEFLKTLVNITVVREFIHPRQNTNSYLLKLNP